MGDDGEGVLVEVVLVFAAADIGDGNLYVKVAEVAPGYTLWLGFDVVERSCAVLGRFEVVQGNDRVASGDKTAVVNGSIGLLSLRRLC